MDAKPVSLPTVSLEEQLRESQEQIRKREEQYRAIFEAAAIGTAISDVDGRLIETNRALQEFLGYSGDELHGMPIAQFTHPDDLAPQLALFQELVEGRRPAYRIEKRYIRKDGSIVWGRLTESLARDVEGKARFTIAMVVDMTERVEAERQLEEKEAQYRSIFEATSDGLEIAELDGRIVEANSALCAMYGYTYDEMIGMNVAQLVGEETLPQLIKYSETLARGETFAGRAVNMRKDGTPLHVEIHGAPFTYQGKPRVLAVVRDITERVKAYELLEQRVAERTRELTTLLEVSRNVASTLELQPLLELILDQLKAVAQYSGAAVFLLEDEHLAVLLRRAPGPDPTAGPSHYSLQEVHPIWDLIRSGEPLILDDVRGDTPQAQSYRRAVGPLLETAFSRERSFMAVPMSVKERVVGVLTLSSEQPGYFTPQHAALAMAIAQQAGIAIENARLYQRAQEAAVLEERSRLARELHDSVSQALYGIALGAQTARVLLERDPSQVAEPLEYVLNQAEVGLAEMRSLIFELRPESLQTEGLVGALNKQVAAIQARYGVVVDATLCPEPAVSFDVKEAAYRIAHEALHNTIKHADARHIELRLAKTDDSLALEVADDGKGFDPGRTFPGHMGLQTMRERAVRLGGTLSVESRPGLGARVRAVIPYTQGG